MHELPLKGLLPVLESEDHWVLLDTARPGREDYHSYLFLRPERILRAEEAGSVRKILAETETALSRGLWTAGLLGYEAGQGLEPALAGKEPLPGQGPLVWLGIYKKPHIFDHRSGKWKHGPLCPAALPEAALSWSLQDLSLEIPQERFEADMLKIKEFIRRGETYQVNYTVRWRFRLDGSPLGLYRALRARQKVPFAAVIRDGNWCVLSLSPELFFRMGDNGRIVTRPMKGTLRRGKSVSEDRKLAHALRRDAKNRAENVMIVDLLRNDLGKVCRTGSVETTRLFTVERYETLFQMTSTVQGRLLPGKGLAAVLAALFPSGSVTGAPKIRTAGIIAELESSPRGAYTGSLGFAAPDGRACFNVAIRTVELHGGRGVLGVGGGIVTDSHPAEEFEECRLKGLFLTGLKDQVAEPDFELVETLLHNGRGFALLELHLARMRESARYFGWSFNRKEAVETLLRAKDSEIGDSTGSRQVVRLLLSRDGHFRTEFRPFKPVESRARVAFYPASTDPKDRLLYHKTTYCPVYAQARAEARARGLFDYIFTNCLGQVTEGAICNVYIQRGGVLYTPPESVGLLRGVYRRHIKRTGNPTLRERTLYPEDLRSADKLFVSNAVHGLLEAELVET